MERNRDSVLSEKHLHTSEVWSVRLCFSCRVMWSSGHYGRWSVSNGFNGDQRTPYGSNERRWSGKRGVVGVDSKMRFYAVISPTTLWTQGLEVFYFLTKSLWIFSTILKKQLICKYRLLWCPRLILGAFIYEPEIWLKTWCHGAGTPNLTISVKLCWNVIHCSNKTGELAAWLQDGCGELLL